MDISTTSASGIVAGTAIGDTCGPMRASSAVNVPHSGRWRRVAEVNMSPTDRRLLIISYHFPPDGAIGGMRWAGISKYLARLGWEVHILTASASAGDTPVPGVHMHVHPRRRTLNSLYNVVKNRLRPAGMRK